MAIGGGKKEKEVRRKTADRRGATGIGKPAPVSGKKRTTIGGGERAAKITRERRVLAAAARGRVRENASRGRGQSKAQANETDRHRNLMGTLPKAKPVKKKKRKK